MEISIRNADRVIIGFDTIELTCGRLEMLREKLRRLREKPEDDPNMGITEKYLAISGLVRRILSFSACL